MSTQTGVELPTSRQLLRSTLIALVAAGTLLATVVLPAEYGIDPTGVGRILGLKQMGEIKQQLSAEAAADRAMNPPADPCGNQRSGLPGSSFVDLFISRAAAAQPTQLAKIDEVSVTLRPNQGTEIKLTMKKGAKVAYSWKVEGGVVNHDTHGERVGSTSSHSYKKGTAVAGDEGVLEAAFDGVHGWFWRNRGQGDVTVRLKVDGDYADVKRMM